MALYKYFKNAPSARLSLSLGPYDVGSQFLKLNAKCRDWFARTGQNSKTINTIRGRHASFSATNSLSSLIASQSLSRPWR